MGTNYYWYANPPCSTCGRNDPPLHIGKSSAGWCFSLHVIPEENINSLEDWKIRWRRGVIKDEYERVVSLEEMLRIITKRFWPKRKLSAHWLEQNLAVQGPRGLVRTRPGFRGVEAGPGTWDLVKGEFS